jgi:hypothetical protein
MSPLRQWSPAAMQSQLVAMLILTSSTQIRGDERPQPKPPPARLVTAIHLRGAAGETHELTLEFPAQAGDDDDQPPARPVMLDLNNAMLERENFDRWLFPHELSERARADHLKEILDARIVVVAQANKLTDRERAKLRLAGRGDIKRFFDEVQKRKDRFEIDRKSFNDGLATLRRLDELSPTYRDGPFGPDSLFVKTLHKIRNDRNTGR